MVQIKNMMYLNQEQNRTINLLSNKQQEGFLEQNRKLLLLQEMSTTFSREQLMMDRTVTNLSESQKQMSRTVANTEKIDKDQQDRIYRNTVMNEKQARNIFRMNMKDKALSRSIEKTRSVNIDQNVRIKRNLAQTKQNILSIIEINKVTNQNKKRFQSENIKAGIKLTTGALVLKTFVISDQPILELDISDKGILFLKNVSYIEGFIAGVTGQIIRIINTGEEKIVLKNEAPNPTQQLKLHQDKVILEKNRGITLIFDGTFWRLLLN